MDQLPAWRRPDPVVLPVRLDPTGRRGPTRSAVRGARWRRTSYGFYVPSSVDGSVPEQRVAEAVPLLAPGGVVTGWGALRMLGAGFVDGRASDGRTLEPVTLAQGRHAHRRSDAPLVRRRQEPVGEHLRIAGVPLHTAARALVDEMRLSSSLELAVVCADAARAAGLLRRGEVERVLQSCAGWQGVARAREAWRLSRDGAESPPETLLRLLCTHLGLSGLLVNAPVFTLGGRFLARPDLLDAEAGLVLEYDGADHRRVGRQRSDNLREEGLRAHGLEVARVTVLDLVRPEELGRRLLDVRARCAFRRPHERAWTLTAPPGWRPSYR